VKNSGSALFFGIEVVLLLLAVGNCFVPGSWTSFWWTECGWLGSAAIAAAISLAARRRSQKRTTRALFISQQSLALLAAVAIIGLLIWTH
jgi:hypothetical protein